jgi:hypothetical protein
MSPNNDNSSAKASPALDDASAPGVNTGALKGKKAETAIPKPCAFCKATCKLTYICKKCGTAAHCTLECYRSDWHKHKFSCSLGRSTDATDYLMLACHTNRFDLDDDVANKYGFMYFASGHDRLRLFKLYRRLLFD